MLQPFASTSSGLNLLTVYPLLAYHCCAAALLLPPEGQGEDAAKPDAATGDADNAAANTGSGAADSEVVLRAVLASIDAEVVSCDEDAVLLERLGQLDQLLTWLWRVHGIDFYAGKELLLEADYVDRTSKLRTIRGPRPEEGEEQDEDEGEAALSGCGKA